MSITTIIKQTDKLHNAIMKRQMIADAKECGCERCRRIIKALTKESQ